MRHIGTSGNIYQHKTMNFRELGQVFGDVHIQLC